MVKFNVRSGEQRTVVLGYVVQRRRNVTASWKMGSNIYL